MSLRSLFRFPGILLGGSLIASATVPLSIHLPATAQSCVPLRVVQGNGETLVKKRISQPGAFPLTNSNWNTDFAVPTGTRFTYYVATVTPENAAPYNVAVNLKYNNNTSSEVYKQDGINLRRNVPYQFRAATPAGVSRQPYQVNLTVSGTYGNTYRARVSACQ